MYRNTRLVRMIVCDMAGTTVNEGGLVYEALDNTFKAQGLFVTDKVKKTWHGVEKREVIANTVIDNYNRSPRALCNLVKLSEELFMTQLDKLYFGKDSTVSLIHPELLDFFSYMRANKIRVTLNTGYPHSFQKKLITYLKLYDHIDDFVSSDVVARGRPTAHMIHRLMSNANITDPTTVVKIGDTVSDIKEGRNANCGLVVGVLSGADNKKDLALEKPDLLLNNIVDLKHHMRKDYVVY